VQKRSGYFFGNILASTRNTPLIPFLYLPWCLPEPLPIAHPRENPNVTSRSTGAKESSLIPIAMLQRLLCVRFGTEKWVRLTLAVCSPQPEYSFLPTLDCSYLRSRTAGIQHRRSHTTQLVACVLGGNDKLFFSKRKKAKNAHWRDNISYGGMTEAVLNSNTFSVSATIENRGTHNYKLPNT